MVCRRGCFIIQRHNELRNLEAEMLKMVCNQGGLEATFDMASFRKDMTAPVKKSVNHFENRNERARNAKDSCRFASAFSAVVRSSNSTINQNRCKEVSAFFRLVEPSALKLPATCFQLS